MKIIEDIKKKIEEMKNEENKYKVYDKNIDGNVDKLIKSLKNELSDISRNIKTSEEKMENFFKTYNKTTVINPRLEKTCSNEDKSKSEDQNFNLVLRDLKIKNNDLISELNVLKENFNDVRMQNTELKDKIVSNNKGNERHYKTANSNSDAKMNRQQNHSIDTVDLKESKVSPINKNENFFIKSMSEKVYFDF